MTPDRTAHRRRLTDELRAALRPSPTFDAWLESSGELAPDFDALPSRPGLWRPDDSPDWRARVREHWQRWMTGRLPPAPGDVDVQWRPRRAAGLPELALTLRFGAARLRARLLLPPDAAPPFPVLMTQACHLPWAVAAARRGLAGCAVSACDDEDDTDSFPPGDASRLARRAWALSRCLDALAGRPEVDASRVALAGHSRNGKTALITAGFDERFAAVVLSSGGVMGTVPARLFRERQFGEGLELLTRQYPEWYHPRLRLFSGREDRLPTDVHELLAVVAPRPLLLSTAVNDQVESTAAVEQTAVVVAGVYERLGAPDALTLRWRPGGHRVDLETVEGYLDWCLQALAGRPRGEPARTLHPLGDQGWAAPGRLPPRAPPTPPRHRRREPPEIALLLGRGRVPRDIGRRRTATGDGVYVDVIGPARRTAGRRPVALWLAPLSRAHGWVAGYEEGIPVPIVLARAGWTVACFDPIGTGGRVLDEELFPPRHPEATLLGRTLRDAQGALDALDAPVAWAVGYAMGARVAAHLGALDPRIAGVACLMPPDLRADLLRPLAPRPVLVTTPSWEPGADAAAVAAARSAWGPAADRLEHRTMPGYHHLGADSRDLARDWLARATGSETAAA